MVAPNGVDHDPASEQGPGPQGFKDMFQMMRTAFPDLEVTSEHMTATENDVALVYNIPGTTLEGQRRYAEDVWFCLEAYFDGEPMEQDHLIVQDGEIVSGSYRAVYG